MTTAEQFRQRDARVLASFRQRIPQVEIARRVGLSPQRVGQIIKCAGVPKPRKRKRNMLATFAAKRIRELLAASDRRLSFQEIRVATGIGDKEHLQDVLRALVRERELIQTYRHAGARMFAHYELNRAGLGVQQAVASLAQVPWMRALAPLTLPGDKGRVVQPLGAEAEEGEGAAA